MCESIPCQRCGKPTTSLGTKRCDYCWERGRHVSDEEEQMLSDYPALLKQRNEAVEILKMVQWASKDSDGDSCCPCCDALEMIGKHKENCNIVKVIGPNQM